MLVANRQAKDSVNLEYVCDICECVRACSSIVCTIVRNCAVVMLFDHHSAKLANDIVTKAIA